MQSRLDTQFVQGIDLSLPQPGELHIEEGGSHDKVDKLSVGEGGGDHLGGKVNNTQEVNGGEMWTGRRHRKVDINIFIDVFFSGFLKKQYVPVLVEIISDLRAQAECAPLVNIRAIIKQPGKESNLGELVVQGNVGEPLEVELVVQVDVGEPLQVDGPRRQQLGGRGLLPLRSQPNTLFKVLFERLNNLSDDPHQGSPQEGEALPLGLLLAPT